MTKKKLIQKPRQFLMDFDEINVYQEFKINYNYNKAKVIPY